MEDTFVVTSAGVKMPKLIYGTAWKKERTAELVEKAIRCGFRGIDTACQPKHYDEAGIGAALVKLNDQGITRDQLFIQSKFTPADGQDPLRTPYDPTAPLDEQVRQSFATSQKNLGITTLDSLLLHSPLRQIKDMMTIWGAMEDLQRKGLVKQLGISNCYDLTVLKNLHEAATVKPTVVQNRFYQETTYDKALRKWCNTQGIHYQGFWTLTANPHLLTNTYVKSLAQEFKKTPVQILFRFLIHLKITPLTGTSSEQHMREDIDIFSFELTQDQVERLEFALG